MTTTLYLNRIRNTSLFTFFISFLILFAASGKAWGQYCTPAYSTGCSWGDNISNVTLVGDTKTLNNSTNCSGGGYGEFTSGVVIPDLTAGDIYYGSVTTGYTSPSSEYFRAWIDWDMDGTFDGSEEIAAVGGMSAGPNAFNFTVPAATPPGEYRMRIRLVYGEAPAGNIQPCTSYSYGETEDYLVEVIATTPCSSVSAGSISDFSVCPDTEFTLKSNGVTTGQSGLTYEWFSSPNGSIWTSIYSGPNPVYQVSGGVTSTTYYKLKVSCSNGGATAETPAVKVSVKSSNECYCIPPDPSSGCSGDNISSVALENLSDLGLTCSPLYEDRSPVQNAIPDLEQDESYSLAIGVGNGGTEHVGIWIDFNQNGIFEAHEFFYLGSGNNTTITNDILIPSDALEGNTKMRVRTKWAGAFNGTDACAQVSYGTTRDYTVNILTSLPCKPPLITTASDIGYIGATMNWMAPLTGPAPINYEVQWSSDGFENLESVTVSEFSHTIPSGLIPDEDYGYRVKSNCGASGPSNWSTVALFRTGDYTPKTVTGFNQDAVAEVGTDPINSTTDNGMDASFYVLPENGFVNEYGTLTSSHGMPRNRVMHNGSTGNITPYDVKYILNRYDAINVLKLSEGNSIGTFKLDKPMPISKLYLAGISTEGNSTLEITLIYEDASEQTLSEVRLDDWYGNSPDYVYEADYRVGQDWVFDESMRWPKMRQISITDEIDTNRKVTHIKIINQTANEPYQTYANLFAVNVKPEWARVVSVSAAACLSDEEVTIIGEGENATKYRVYKSENGTDYTETDATPTSDGYSTFTFTDVNLGGSTSFWVEAVNDAYQTSDGYTYTNPQRVKVDVESNDRQFIANNGLWSTASNWSHQEVPDIDKCVRVLNDNILTVDINTAEAKNVFVEEGGKIIISGGKSLTVADFIKGEGTEEQIIIETDGNLLQQEDNAEHTAVIRAERFVENIKTDILNGMDYIYWSSPVFQQILKGEDGFSPDTPIEPQHWAFLEYNEKTDYLDNTHDTYFKDAKGYAIRAEENGGESYSKTYAFTGLLNNGFYSIPVTNNKNGFNLVGNPYPSNINAEEFWTLNSNTLNQLILFWTNALSYDAYQQGSNYSGNNYAMLTGSGGVPPTYQDDPEGDPASQYTPTEEINIGQGFLVEAKAAGDVIFDNSIRVKDDALFFSKEPKDRYWLTLTSPSKIVNTTLIGYIPGATDGYDPDYDAPFFGASDGIYTFLPEGYTIIQGRQHPLDIRDVVPLGTQFYEDGVYVIALQEVEGTFVDTQVYLIDKELGYRHNLSKEAYKFFTFSGTFNDRFEIRYRKVGFGTSADANLITAATQKEDIIILSTLENIREVQLFDVLGMEVYQTAKVNAKDLRIPAGKWMNSILFAKITTEDGEVTTTKVLLKH